MADRLPEPAPGQMPSSFDSNPDFHNEKAMQKVVRKLKEEPLVPLGIGLTVFAFVNAYRALRKGDSKQANRMFRARVMAQGFTVIAMVAGSMYYSKDREKSAELRKLQEAKDAEEKRNKWIRELEIRDAEEQAMKSRLQEKAAAAAGKLEGKVEEAAKEATEGTGGILGRMGLWSQGEKAAEEAKAREAETAQQVDVEHTKMKNPKSSLGDLGQIMSSQKKDKEEPKK